MSGKKVKDKKANFRGFVPFTIDKQVKQTVSELDIANDELMYWFFMMSQQGYKCGVTWEDERGCHHVSFYGQRADGDNAGLMLGARHVDIVKALRILYVLHEVVFAGTWASPETAANQYDW